MEICWVDTHCHLGESFYKEFGVVSPDCSAVVREAKKAGVKILVNSGTSPSSNLEAIKIAEKFSGLLCSIGIHPHETSNLDPQFCSEEVEKNIGMSNKVISIGEVGLDYHFEKDEKIKERQRLIFDALLEVAEKRNFPVVLHCRDAWRDIKRIVKSKQVKGIFHCFTGSYEEAKWCLDKGFLLGIGGIVTFSNATGLVDVVKKIGIGNIVLETDAPWLAPEGYRGKVNSPKFIPIIGEFLSKILGVSIEEVKKETHENFLSLFKEDNLLKQRIKMLLGE